MKLGDALELVAGIIAVAAGWYKVGLWLALVIAAVYVFYIAQVYADTGSGSFPSLQKVNIQPGDTVIVRIPASLDPDEFASVQAQVQKTLSDNRVVVLPSTAEVASWRPRGYEEPVAKPSRWRLRFGRDT